MQHDAWLHLLHMHPVREFWDAQDRTPVRSCTPSATCADWRGAIYVARMLHEDVQEYRRRLGADAAIVLATPHTLCPSKFYGSYQRFLSRLRLNRTETLSACVEWASQRSDGDSALAREVCSRNTFDENGAATIAQHFREVAAANLSWVHLLDMHAMIAGRCNHTSDGRHYDAIVRAEEIDRLAQISRAGSRAGLKLSTSRGLSLHHHDRS